MSRRLAPAALLLASFALSGGAGCKTMYYSVKETLGEDKRDILVDRVEDARESQEKAREQFRDALEKFQSVVSVDGGDLEAKYKQLRGEFEQSESRAKTVSDRVKSVKEVSEDLFKEWEKELSQYTNAELRRESERQLRETRGRYEQLVSVMERAEATMHPVLDAFRNQVLFLKHNLNARAIASLQGEAADLRADIERLIADMNRSIDEANEFIRQMGMGEKKE